MDILNLRGKWLYRSEAWERAWVEILCAVSTQVIIEGMSGRDWFYWTGLELENQNFLGFPGDSNMHTGLSTSDKEWKEKGPLFEEKTRKKQGPAKETEE